MKKVVYKKIGLLMLVCTAVLGGCKDSYLETSDPNAVSSFPTSLNQVDLLVASVYGNVHNWEFMGHYWAGYGIYCLDHTVDMSWHGDQSWIDVSCGTVQVGNRISSCWRALSRGVYYANMALDGIEAYRKVARSSEIDRLDQYRGETLFLRGFYWWHMLSLYGEPQMDGVGIPILRTLAYSLEEMQVPREKTGVCYQAIIDDWKEASTLLKNQTDVHRATEWSAKAALAKACLFAGDNAGAKTCLKDCIDNSGKKLVSFEEFKMMFNGDSQYEYNNESFFEVGNKGDPENGQAYGSSNTGTAMSILYAHCVILPDGTRQSTSYANQYAHDRNLLRYGYHDPAPLSQMEQADDTYRLKQSYIDQQLERRALAGRQEDGPDPRLWVSILQPFFDSAQYRINSEMIYCKIAQGEPSGKWWEMSPTTGNDPQTWYGWPTRKYQYMEGHLGNDSRNVAGYNFYFIRLPDIYLMYAEILKNEGNTAEALEYVNKVHRRAYGYPPDAPSPVDYRSLTDRTKTVDPADPLANDPLLYERWAELFGEMRWWEDVRRLRMGPSESAYYVNVHGPGDRLTPITWREAHYAMPVPTVEMEFNTNAGMIQTPGYQ